MAWETGQQRALRAGGYICRHICYMKRSPPSLPPFDGQPWGALQAAGELGHAGRGHAIASEDLASDC